MERTAAQAMAEALLTEFGVDRHGWRFGWNRRKSSYGLCRYDTRHLELSGPLVDVNDADVVEEVIRHELAHILAGPGAAHGRTWKEWCAVTGAVPRACTAGNGVPTRWIGVCRTPGCATVLRRHRLSAAARDGACADCCREAGGFDPRSRLTWIDTRNSPSPVPGVGR